MIPIRDELQAASTPWVNYTLLAINVVLFTSTAIFGLVDYELFVQENGLIPLQAVRFFDAGVATDMLMSMFLHGSLLHLAGNMLYLWIFGDNVEDAMGHAPYLLFYLLGGLVASLAHVLANPYSTVPTIGASGAVAAILGAYLMLYPSSRVQTIIPLGFFVRMAMVPAVIVLGLWFLFELVRGLTSLGMPPGAGGIAFWAHIGGFATGFVLARFFAGNRDRYGGPNF